MASKLSLALAASLLALPVVPAASAQFAEESLAVSTPGPVNQTANATVTVADDGDTILTVTTSGDATNETREVTVIEDPFQTVFETCNAVLGLVGIVCR